MHLAEFVTRSKKTLSNQNALANSIAGFNAEFIEYTMTWETSRLDFDAATVADELGDMAFYLSAIINTVDFQMSKDDVIDLYLFYWDTVDTMLAGSLLSELGDVNSMFKKIVAHNIPPNKQYKCTGNTFNEILLRNLAYIMRVCLDDLNAFLPTTEQYTIGEIFELNIEKLQGENGRHKDGFDGSYNLTPEYQELDEELSETEERLDKIVTDLDIDPPNRNDDLYEVFDAMFNEQMSRVGESIKRRLQALKE